MKPELIDFVEKFKGKRILIIGDMIADIYLKGDISRISREAPVLVLIESEEKTVAGGAANVVNNVATLGGKAFAVGILGEDKGALNLKQILEENNVNTSIVELCLQYIRKDKYNSDAWEITAGNINEEFVKYVNEKSKELSNYNFQNAKIPNANIDFVHMCASLNAIIYNSKIIPSEYSGWAGDLVTLMGQIIKYDENKTNNELIKYGNSLIGANSTNTLFNEKDIYIVLNEHNIDIFLLIFFLLLRSRYGLIWLVC